MSITRFIPKIRFQLSGDIIFFLANIFILYWFGNLTSCTFLNEEDLLDGIQCDTIDVSYNELTYIFTGICTSCHSEVFTYRDGIKMDSYDNVRASINTGLVMPAIIHADGVPPMPKGMKKLTDCEISKIEAWINKGMPENK